MLRMLLSLPLLVASGGCQFVHASRRQKPLTYAHDVTLWSLSAQALGDCCMCCTADPHSGRGSCHRAVLHATVSRHQGQALYAATCHRCEWNHAAIVEGACPAASAWCWCLSMCTVRSACLHMSHQIFCSGQYHGHDFLSGSHAILADYLRRQSSVKLICHRHKCSK